MTQRLVRTSRHGQIRRTRGALMRSLPVPGRAAAWRVGRALQLGDAAQFFRPMQLASWMAQADQGLASIVYE
jgi:hypothetical protein